jgi:hypothetical protein
MYNTSLFSGTQFGLEYQVTVPTTSGQESLDISFAPIEKVSQFTYLSVSGEMHEFFSCLKQKD